MLRDAIIQAIVDGAEDQRALVEKLKKAGYDITQSSISRKLKQIGVIKIQGRYVLPKNENKTTSIVFLEPNLLIIRTAPGYASSIASTIDRKLVEDIKHPEFVGTIAGDDTIFLAVNLAKSNAAQAISKLKEALH
jgi:transcriptional regulator of arginine metabolism